ncbi:MULTISPECIES: hypothetical protein [Pseudomonas]|uniref:hypothetical protein n=1 Tax=Pseudomonas TaxID=286 RepID=UPI00235EF51D|nr:MULTISPECIES: hypothetical protein [Pseudomonas]WJV25545.1 hypothetical protein PSR66_05750 [Pseudomonas chlororaphis]
MQPARFLRALLFGTMLSAANSVCAQLAFSTDVVTVHVVNRSLGYKRPSPPALVTALVKITDNHPRESPACWEKIPALLPPGECQTRFEEDLSLWRPCYVVHLWEDDTPVPEVKVTILDTVGFDSWMLLEYASMRKDGYAGGFRVEIGWKGLSSENRQTTYEPFFLSRSDFDPERPYRLLYTDADKDMRVLYNNRLASFQRTNNEKQVTLLQEAQRRWVYSMEDGCRDQPPEQAERCQWIATQQRLFTLKDETTNPWN